MKRLQKTSIAAGYPTLLAIDNSVPEIWSGQANICYHSSQDASDKLANDPASPSGVTYDYDFAADGTASILFQYHGPYTGSLDDDGDIDLHDYAAFARVWRSRQGQPHWDEGCDISIPADNVIDVRDLAVLANHWLSKPRLAKSPPPSAPAPKSPYPPR